MSGINAGGVYSELVLNASKFNEGMQNAQSKMNDFENKMSKMGKTLKKAGKNWTTKVTLPIVGVGVAATKLGIDFQSSMSEVQAVSGATGQDMVKLEGLAREMGAATKFSASEAAESLGMMGLAGWDTQQMMAGLEPVLLLAGAAGLELEESARYVTNTIGQFGLEAEDATRVTDVLAHTQANAQTDVRELGHALEYAGVGAAAMGYDIEETSAILGVFAEAGLVGSKAGTALNAMFRDMKDKAENGSIAIGDTRVEIVDSNGEYRKFTDILTDVNKATEHMTTVEKDAALMKIFGSQAMAGMNIVTGEGTDKLIEFEKGVRDADGASKDMYDTMQDNLKGSIDNIKASLEEAALQIFDLLLPSLEKWLEKGQQLINWFTNLDKGTQETILKIAGFAAAIGPVLSVAGKLEGGIGSIVGLMGKLSGAATVAGGASTAMGGGLGIAGGAAKASTLLFNPWVLGATAVGVGAVALAKHLQEDAVPAFELFDDTISQTTKETLGSFLDMEKEATASLRQLAWSGAEVSEEMYNEITGNTNEMADQVIGKLEEQKKEGLKHLKEMLDKSVDMSEEEKEDTIRIAEEKYQKQIEETKNGKDEIESILKKAKDNNTNITEEERKQIEGILNNLKDNSIELMTESQEEQENILNKLKDNADRITLEMASDVIKNSIEQKEKTIAEATEQYNEVVRLAESMKKGGTEESIELANNMISEATRQKEDTIKQAEEMHEGVVREVENQGGDVIKQLNTDNGEMKLNWESLKDWFMRNPIIRRIFTRESDSDKAEKNDRSRPAGRNAHGTNYWRGGLTWVGEQGPELIELPKGSKVHSNQKSEGMSSNNVVHSGTITVRGVNNRGELVAIVEKELTQKIVQDDRRLPNRSSIVPI